MLAFPCGYRDYRALHHFLQKATIDNDRRERLPPEADIDGDGGSAALGGGAIQIPYLVPPQLDVLALVNAVIAFGFTSQFHKDKLRNAGVFLHTKTLGIMDHQ